MYHVINFTEMGDSRGALVAIESGGSIPFDLKRVFYVYGSKGDVTRGCHANRKTKFVLIAVNGSCVVTVNDGTSCSDVVLNKPTIGLFLDRLVWKEMHSFSEDAVLLVMCSEHYDKDEYVFDYEVFLKEINNESIV